MTFLQSPQIIRLSLMHSSSNVSIIVSSTYEYVLLFVASYPYCTTCVQTDAKSFAKVLDISISSMSLILQINTNSNNSSVNRKWTGKSALIIFNECFHFHDINPSLSLPVFQFGTVNNWKPINLLFPKYCCCHVTHCLKIMNGEIEYLESPVNLEIPENANMLNKNWAW